ncbi:hypothetical protein KKB18_01715, partial [bacterium]|nr:hypothetical protein [bacterium]
IKLFEDAKKTGKELSEDTIKNFHKSVTEYIKWASQISKVSQVINMSAQDLTSLALVAEREASVGFYSFVKAMEELNLSMTKAQDVTSDATKAFAKLKVNIEEGGKLRSVVDVFYDIADSIKNTQDASRSGIAQMIMGDFGDDLIPMLENGKTRIMELSREFKTMGVTINTLDASALDELYKRVMMMETRYKAPGKWINELLVPYKEFISIPFEETFIKVWNFFSELLGFKEAPERVKKLSENVQELKEKSEQLKTPLDNVSKTTQEIGDNSEKSKKKLAKVFDASIFTAFQGAIDNATILMNNFCTAFECIVDLKDELALVAQNIQKMAPTQEQLDKTGKLADYHERLASAGTGDYIQELPVDGIAYQAVLTELPDPFKKGMSDWEKAADIFKKKWHDVVESIKGDFTNLSYGAAYACNILLDSATAVYDAMQNIINTFQNELSDAFYRMFEDGQSFTASMNELWEEMKKAFKRAVADMIAAFATSVVASAIMDKGGFAWKGAGSLPKIPHAAKGLMTTGRGPIPAILHPNEVVIPMGYIREFFGSMAERLFKYMSLPPVPSIYLPSIAGAGASKVVNINLNVGAGNFDDPSYWRNLFRTKIKPAMDDVNYGRI